MPRASHPPANGRSKRQTGLSRAVAPRSTEGLHGCDVMRAPLAEPRSFPPSRSKGAARRRRLARGVDRWIQDDRLQRRPAKRVMLLLFTSSGQTFESVEGRIRDFWHTVRDRWGDQQYFSWLEITAAGAPHYHAMWVDPPVRDDARLKRWLERTWGRGFVKIRNRSDYCLRESGAKYITAEAKKWGHQQYQHDYESVPSSIRTFQCQRLGWPGPVLDQHRTRQVVAHVPGHANSGQWIEEHLVVVAELRHVPHGTCELARAGPDRRRGRPPRRSLTGRGPEPRRLIGSTRSSPAGAAVRPAGRRRRDRGLRRER